MLRTANGVKSILGAALIPFVGGFICLFVYRIPQLHAEEVVWNMGMAFLLCAGLLVVIAWFTHAYITDKRNRQLRSLDLEGSLRDIKDFAILHKVDTDLSYHAMPFSYCSGELVGKFFASYMHHNPYKDTTHCLNIARSLAKLKNKEWSESFLKGLKMSRHYEGLEYAGFISHQMKTETTLYEAVELCEQEGRRRKNFRRKLGLKPEIE